jgi:hypothetical protein
MFVISRGSTVNLRTLHTPAVITRRDAVNLNAKLNLHLPLHPVREMADYKNSTGSETFCGGDNFGLRHCTTP